MNEVLAHTIIAIVVIVAYVVVTVFGFDGTPIIALLGGQALGAGASALSRRGSSS